MRRRILLVAASLLVGCAEDSAAPDPPPAVLGHYVASSVKVGTFDALTELVGMGATMSLDMVGDSTFTIATNFPAPYAPFWNDPGGYVVQLTGSFSLGSTQPNLHLVADDSIPEWVTTSIRFLGDSISGRFLTDPDHDIEIRFVLQRLED